MHVYKPTFHVTKYKNEMKFHMLMFMNAWMMLVLMKCKCQMQCLTQRCYRARLVRLRETYAPAATALLLTSVIRVFLLHLEPYSLNKQKGRNALTPFQT